jgi:hypothetical protein
MKQQGEITARSLNNNNLPENKSTQKIEETFNDDKSLYIYNRINASMEKEEK